MMACWMSDDRTALLAAAHGTPNAVLDRRMDMNGDGAITQADFHVWQTNFIEWKKRAK